MTDTEIKFKGVSDSPLHTTYFFNEAMQEIGYIAFGKIIYVACKFRKWNEMYLNNLDISPCTTKEAEQLAMMKRY